MFEEISGTQRSLLWLAVIMSLGYTVFTACAIIPLIRELRESRDFLRNYLKVKENHAASCSPDADRPLPGDNG